MPMLSSYIVNSNPKIKAVFESWKEITPESFYSNLQKNEELKNTILENTPWVLEAENESEQKQRIGLLFDMNRMSNELDNDISKLSASQLPNGAWPWFKGMHEDRHTTQQIVLGIGKLVSKNVISLSANRELNQMIRKAVNYLDAQIVEDYEKLIKNNPKGMKNDQLSGSQIEYLYARSLLSYQFPVPAKAQTAFDYYLGQAKQYWLKKSNYLQGMIAITMLKFGYRNEAEGIMRSLKERALYSDEMGMYWRQEVSWRWYEAPVETQAMLIDAFEQVTNDEKSVEQMKIWLLKQKQTTSWKTSSATAEAVYALLFNGQDLLSEDKLVEVKVGGKKLVPKEIEGTKVEAGTGYFKTSWKGEEIKADMGNIEVTNPNTNIAWGAAYWQYFENLDRIKSQNTPLKIEKLMFVEELTDKGPVMKPMQDGQELKTGDKVIVRLVIGTDRDLEYVHLKDMRASALEPMDQLSGYSYKAGLGYYRNVTDVATEFFIQYMRKGTYVLEYPLMVTQKGEFSNGIATIQSFYAPEFAAHSEGKRLIVK
jgi:Bacterial Alpha-2-macroglobulin MG10 domain